MAVKFPNIIPHTITEIESYSISEPVGEFVIVTLKGAGSFETNKPQVGLPLTTEEVIGISYFGNDEVLEGELPSQADSHIAVVKLGTFPLKVAPGQTINVGDRVGYNAAGEAVAPGTGIDATDIYLAEQESLGTSTALNPDYIRVNIK